MSSSESADAAIIFVHGIGSQEPGQSLRAMASALGQGWSTATVDFQGEVARVSVDGKSIRLQEAYWADILEGDAVKNSFDATRWAATAWLPLLQSCLGLVTVLVRPRRWRTIPQKTLILFGAAFWAPFVSLVIGSFIVSSEFVLRVFIGRRLQNIQDSVVSDVMNYVRSSSGLIGEDGPQSQLLTAAPEMVGRIDDALDQVFADGCATVIVIAHSLGSVLAYEALGEHHRALREDATSRPHLLITVGSPLGRFAYVWPWVLHRGPLQVDTWVNYYDPFDFVSTRLRPARRWGVNNVRLFGRTGLFRSHTTYLFDLRVQRLVGTALGISPPNDPPRSSQERLAILLRSLIDFSVQLALALGGLLFTVLIAVFGAALYTGVDPTLDFSFGFIGMLGLLVLLPVFFGLYRAALWMLLLRCPAGSRGSTRFMRWEDRPPFKTLLISFVVFAEAVRYALGL